MKTFITKNKQKGFTMLETLVALAIITIISLVALGSLAPWMNFKSKLDTQRRIQDVRQGIASAYADWAMQVETQPGGQLGQFKNSTPSNGICEEQPEGFAIIGDYFSESPQQLMRDGFGNPWCLFISAPLKTQRDGVELYFRNMAIVSTGFDGVLDANTKMNEDGTLVVDGDDMGSVVSGRDIQGAKLKETMRRMNRIAQIYETYFTNRYLANSSRDIGVYYFSKAYDSTGVVDSTGGNWGESATVLGAIGVSVSEGISAWEVDNTIQVGNHSEAQGAVTARSPATAGVGALPYTAILRARIPAPGNQPAYITQVIVGGY